MEYIVVFLALLFCYGMFLLIAIRDQRRSEARFLKKIREGYGSVSDKTYQTERLRYLSLIVNEEKNDHPLFVDDVTWNDLDMDRVMGRLDDTNSSIGEEALYRLLRFPETNVQRLAKRNGQITFLCGHDTDREQIFLTLHRIGYAGKYGIKKYLDSLENAPKVSIVRIVLTDLLILVSLVLGLTVHIGFFAAFLLFLIINVTCYLKDKNRIAPYLSVFFYMLGVLAACERRLSVSKECRDVFSDETEEIEKGKKIYASLSRHTFFLAVDHEGSGGNELLSLLMMYVNMIFHLDLVSFQRSVHCIREKKEEIAALFRAFGRMEAIASIACFRKSLPYYAIPEFTDTPRYLAKEMYHPLLKQPVANDIDTARSILLTGSNASGKSTFLKAMLINTILAQTVMTCCAKSYNAGFFAPFSSMALRDNIFSGESYFVVEIRSLKRIFDEVRKETIPVLCAVDEVLRGTNTAERIGAGCVLLEALAKGNCLCVAATHDLELTKLLSDCFVNYHFEEAVQGSEVRFSYKMKEGPATGRNAIRLLSSYGFDPALTQKAEALARTYLRSGDT